MGVSRSNPIFPQGYTYINGSPKIQSADGSQWIKCTDGGSIELATSNQMLWDINGTPIRWNDGDVLFSNDYGLMFGYGLNELNIEASNINIHDNGDFNLDFGNDLNINGQTGLTGDYNYPSVENFHLEGGVTTEALGP